MVPVSETTTTVGAPTARAGSLEQPGEFVVVAGLVLDVISSTRVAGHIDLDDRHHTLGHRPRRRLHDRRRGAASIGASAAVEEKGQVAVGLTNTTHFLRSLTSGRVLVEGMALNQGRTQQLWRVDITDGAGTLVAHGEVRLQNIAPAPETGRSPPGGEHCTQAASSA